jgi:hypothetical protein
MKTFFLILSVLCANTLYSNPILPCTVSLPNHFNPNINYGSLIEIQTKGVFKLDVTIYNNWGQEIIKSDISYGWSNPFNTKENLLKIKNTTILNNNQLNQGDYYYSIEFVCLNGDKISDEGSLKLIKNEKK